MALNLQKNIKLNLPSEYLLPLAGLKSVNKDITIESKSDLVRIGFFDLFSSILTTTIIVELYMRNINSAEINNKIVVNINTKVILGWLLFSEACIFIKGLIKVITGAYNFNSNKLQKCIRIIRWIVPINSTVCSAINFANASYVSGALYFGEALFDSLNIFFNINKKILSITQLILTVNDNKKNINKITYFLYSNKLVYEDIEEIINYFESSKYSFFSLWAPENNKQFIRPSRTINNLAAANQFKEWIKTHLPDNRNLTFDNYDKIIIESYETPIIIINHERVLSPFAHNMINKQDFLPNAPVKKRHVF